MAATERPDHEALNRAFEAGYELGRQHSGLATLLIGVIVGAAGTAFWFWVF